MIPAIIDRDAARTPEAASARQGELWRGGAGPLKETGRHLLDAGLRVDRNFVSAGA